MIGGIVVGFLIAIVFMVLAVHLISRAFLIHQVIATIVDSTPFNKGSEVFTVECELPSGKTHTYRFVGNKYEYVVGQDITCYYDPRKRIEIQTDLHVGGRNIDFLAGLSYLILAVGTFYAVMRWFVFSDPTMGEEILIADSLKSLLK